MQRFVKLVLLVCCFGFSKQHFSQDIRGGWVEYKWISGYSYSITANLMVDSTLGGNRGALQIYGCNIISLNYSGSTNAGKVKVGKYCGVINLSGPGSCLVEIDEPQRVPFIRNIIQSHHDNLNVYSILNVNSFIGPNSTPIFNPPTNLIDNPNTIVYSMSAVDLDGDSLSYQLIKCSRGQSLSKNHILFPNATIDNNGTLAIPKDSTGLFAFCIQMIEWRKDASQNWQAINETIIDFVVDMVSSVGINELNKKEIILLFPNPTSNILNLKINSKTNSEIEITNQLGQTVLKQKYSENIDVSKLVPGCYFIRIDNSYSKFIKE